MVMTYFTVATYTATRDRVPLSASIASGTATVWQWNWFNQDFSVPVAVRHESPYDLQQRFAALADEWRRETKAISSDSDIAMHEAYQRIIGMGERAIPLILYNLQRSSEPDHWYWALMMIARENPVPLDEAGDLRRMRDRWLDWGRMRGYLGSTWTIPHASRS